MFLPILNKFTPFPSSLFPHKLIAEFVAINLEGMLVKHQRMANNFFLYNEEFFFKSSYRTMFYHIFFFGKTPWCKMRSASRFSAGTQLTVKASKIHIVQECFIKDIYGYLLSCT